MILAVDIGNSNICFGAMEGLEIRQFIRILSRRETTATEYTLQLRSMLKKAGLTGSDFEGCIISSVVPQLTTLLAETCAELCGVEPILVGDHLDTGFGYTVPEPERIGRDRLVDATAALALYGNGGPVVTIDLGTATTINVISRDRKFLGGLIYPGVQTSLTALSSKAAQLPPIPLDVPERLIGQDAVSCMNSGIVNGTAAMLDGLMDRIEAELGEPLTCVLTGGLAKFILPCCRRDFIYDQDLLLKGLALLYRRNN